MGKPVEVEDEEGWRMPTLVNVSLSLSVVRDEHVYTYSDETRTKRTPKTKVVKAGIFENSA